jgi:glycerol kinase
MTRQLILAIDQGTTSTRAIVFDRHFRPRAVRQIPLRQSYPAPGWVEHDPEEIWRAALQVSREAMDEVGGPDLIAAIGLTNQRETTVVWDRATGAPVHPAIVWQDRRTEEVCARLRAQGREAAVQARTGLVLDPYFSGSKIAWILDHGGVRRRAEAGELAFGTIDSFLLWRLTGGRVHATDVTNAARTALLDIGDRAWAPELAELFNVPMSVLPDVRPCAGEFGLTQASVFGCELPVMGMAGDQHAALVGHGALKPGDTKMTYGTGGFLVSNVGPAPVASTSNLLSTIGYQADGRTDYALEGSIFSVGATVQWLAEGLHALKDSRESEAVAQGLPDNGGVYLVPAFTGLGAPYWNARARGGIFGLTRDTTAPHLVRAGLEALAYQTRDLLDALARDGAPPPGVLKVDGGVTANAWAMQFLADICAVPVERPAFQELTAVGAARLAAFGCGLIDRLDAEPPRQAPARWDPQITAAERDRLLDGWRSAVAGVLAASRPG